MVRRAWVNAMRWGDWGAVAGAFLDCWSHRRHVVDPFALPSHWPRLRSGDWGSAVPSSFGWWGVVTEPYKTVGGIWLPRGCKFDETDGHIDDLACFVAPGEIVMQWTDDRSEPQWEIYQEAFAILSEPTSIGFL